MGYTIGDKQVAQALVRAGREQPWTDRYGSARITEPGGIFMRTQIVKLDAAAPEPDTDGVLTITTGMKRRVEITEEDETETRTLETTDEPTDGINLEETPISPQTQTFLTTDVYNQRFLLAIPPSEVFGTLKQRWVAGQKALIGLSAGFSISGETEAEMYAAPVVLAEELAADTQVTCRFIKSLGEWRFFVETGSGTEGGILTASGNALEGFGTHEGRTVWATQLSAASDDVRVYRTVAVLHDQPAIASDDETPWLVFPTEMTGVWDRPTHVRGNHFRASDGKIYLKSDFGLIYTKNGTDYHPTFQTFNTMDCWRAAENGPFLYADGYGKWMDGDLGILHESPSQENWGATGGRYGGDNIQDLGFAEKSKPYWECATTYGVYEPRNGATGTLTFGLPTWTVPDDGGTQTFRRSWKKTDGHWIYEGVVTCDAIEYVDITWQTGPERWVLGVLGSELRGWYESATELTTNGTAVFTFAVNPQEDKTFTPAGILRGWERTGGEIVYSTERDAYEIAHTPVAWWSLSAGTASGIEFTFTFHAPEGSEVTGQPQTVTLAEILDRTQNIVYDAPNEQFLIGTIGDPDGWWTAPESDFQTPVTFAFTPADREDLTFTFREYIDGNNTEEIWYITPEIIT